ncbi:nucleoside/nucleotide kinase family protein [Nocardioides speluncae]|uniref:nucleoside/nucleotide kinase family protein n=1 Tax=Nocardioides speluncae TaxID=2670337 RepID=UPI001F0C9B77|nr:nucleoside/nucleotide kinase family protein [Nocardioides speluncae]
MASSDGTQISLPGLARYLLIRSSGATAEGRRLVAGIVGPPAAGKSRLAGRLREEVNRRAGRVVAEIAPMDGFHLPNETLDAAGSRARKGEPDTFDAVGYAELLARVRGSVGETVGWPTFDRGLDAPVPAGVSFGPVTTIVITEGNYLLLPDGPWAAVRGLLDVAWYLDVDAERLRPRLLRRHVRGGRTPDDAAIKADASDLQNAVLIAGTRHRADVVLRPAEGRFYCRAVSLGTCNYSGHRRA